MPTFWQMFNGERNVGITIHYMSEKIDEGRALFQDSLEIEAGESLQELNAGTQRAVPLSASEGTYFTFPTIEEIRQFHRRGLRAI